jgi:uncharacterized protein (DUF2267 family)
MSSTTPTVTPPVLDEPAVRASDADRHRVERILQEALGAGMLTLEEVEERLAGAHAARFRHDLPPLVRDLPVDELAPGDPSVAGWLPRLLALVVHVLGAVRAAVLTATVRQRVLGGLVVLAAVVVAVVALSAGLETAFSPEDGEHLTGG